MSANTIKIYHVYIDASYSQTAKLGVAGYLIFADQKDHQNGDLSKALIKTQVISEKNNIRVELRSLLMALDHFSMAEIDLTIYSDCKSMVELSNRRQRLEKSHYQSSRTHKLLANADLYQQLFIQFDRLKPKLIWVKGHTALARRSLIHQNFSTLDKLIRKKLKGML